jgi:uncharacterized repeat protein (TIGR03803 family)
VLHYFTFSDGDFPNGLIADGVGNLYGTTSVGGAGHGIVFKLTPPGTYTVLYAFMGGSDGGSPNGLTADRKGNLYGTAGGGAGSGTVFKLSPPANPGGAWTKAVLYSFCNNPGPCRDGAGPDGSLIADSAGNLYGTTYRGGGSDRGVVFKLSTGGAYTVLHSFSGGSDGANPYDLIADNAGNLYGTTLGGSGTVFKLSPGGAYTVLHSFTGGSDGGFPSGLIASPAGNLYGTTAGGGTNACPAIGCGTVFKLSPPPNPGGAWTETVLYSLCSRPGCSDGQNPGGVVADSAGNLYGAALGGGGAASERGVVFKLTPGGIYTVVYSFCSKPSCREGASPSSDLIADSAGNLYGTTPNGGGGGCNGIEFGCGVVFKLSRPANPGGAWAETVLYSFCSKPSCSDGASPQAGLIADTAGNLYGTTSGGGASSGRGARCSSSRRLPILAEPGWRRCCTPFAMTSVAATGPPPPPI